MATRWARPLAAAAVLVPLVSCSKLPGLSTTPTASNITGTVVKDGVPVPNATVVLLSKVGNQYVDQAVKSTSNIGSFTFDNVPPGTYRVAFDRATPSERKDPTRAVIFQAGTDTYGFLSTDPFELAPNQTRQIPVLNVSWAANLVPGPEAPVSAPVSFSWNNAEGARSYRVRIANAQDNTIFTSPALPAGTTRYVWSGRSSTGARVPAGTYYWSVNVDTVQGFGGTNISAFNLR